MYQISTFEFDANVRLKEVIEVFQNGNETAVFLRVHRRVGTGIAQSVSSLR